jgi:putative tricarboxylic transport membrane protein
MRRSNVAVSLFLLGLAGFVLFQSRSLAFGSIRTPQTGFFPILLACLLLVLSFALLGQALRQSATAPSLWRVGSEGWKRIGSVFLILMAFALVLESVGFLISTFLLMVLLLRAIDPQKWHVVIAAALSTALVSYFLFAWLLNIPLPAGLLGI